MIEELSKVVQKLEREVGATPNDDSNVLELGARLHLSLVRKAMKQNIPTSEVHRLYQDTYQSLPSCKHLENPEYQTEMAKKYLKVYETVEGYLKEQEMKEKKGDKR